jgi:FkbM family methyltransferase
MSLRHWIARLTNRHKAAVPRILYARSPTGNFYLIEGDALSGYIQNGDVHEPHFVSLVSALLGPADNVLDLGANLGTHTVLMASKVPDGRVFSFEPLSLTFSQLQMNIHANGLTNVTPFKLALSDRTGDFVAMQAVDYSSANLNIGATRVSTSGRGDGTISIRLDDLELPKIAFAKIDIQGSEYRALLGMRQLIDRDRPVLFIEIEEKYLREFGTSSEQLITHLFSLGYTLFRIKTAYPCDHVAVPNERLDKLEPRVTAAVGTSVDKLHGTGIRLRFGSSKYTYDDFSLS